jgi:hypothetical protein
MKRTILVVISCLLLLGLLAMALPGCGTPTPREVGNGTQVCVFPKAAWAPYSAYISMAFIGINWTNVEYTGTGTMAIPAYMTGNWSTW